MYLYRFKMKLAKSLQKREEKKKQRVIMNPLFHQTKVVQ